VRAAAVRDGVLIDYAVERPGALAAPGDVYRGRVTARVPAMAGAFVALGERLDGFLPDSAGGKAAREGTVLAVRVTRAPQGGKGPRLAAIPTHAAAGAAGPAGRLARGPGAVERLAAIHPDAGIRVDDRALCAALRAAPGGRAEFVADCFAEIAERVDALADRVVALPNGGRVSIEPTAALVAIDVDLGGAAAGRDRKAMAHRAANDVAIREVVRQIRLRALGGPIVVDLAGLSPRARQALAPAFQAGLADDPAAPRFLGFSALGLAEILRPRTVAPLHELRGSAHGAALEAARAVALAVAADPTRAPALWAAPDVAEALGSDAEALGALAARCGRPLLLHTAPGLPARSWSLAPP
jgi:hypothetical protein